MSDYHTFSLGDFELQSGDVLSNAKLAYQAWGELNSQKSNVVLIPTFYTGTHIRNEGYTGADRPLDPNRHFIISINLFGNGLSTSPSNAEPASSAGHFPQVTFYDNVAAQQRLLWEVFGIEQILLVTGWSMAGCQTFQWASQFPDRVSNALPFCGSAKTSPHNAVFLEGVKAALTADPAFNDGFYDAPPERGLRAFGRVYAGWAYSQTFFREKLHQQMGFEHFEDLLLDWEQDHLHWDANNLLAKLATWQAGDISDNARFNGQLEAALNEISANTIIIAVDNDLYFQPADNELEIPHIKNGELRVFESPWGHCAASPGNDTGFAEFLDAAIAELIG
ncbi:MAG: alpha/beta fold hydrolase [Pseudomonadota bacterium]